MDERAKEILDNLDAMKIGLDELSKGMVEDFVEKVIVWLGQKLEIQWKFKK